MAFCNSCGAQLEGDSRFCAKCGADQAAKAGGAPAPAAVPVAPPHNMPFLAPGQVPMSVALPPSAPAHKSGMVWLGVIVAAAGAYYYYSHYMQPQTQPAQTPPVQTQPGNPPQQPGTYPQQQPGNPGQQPGGYPQQQPGGYPQQQPGGYPQQQPGGYPQQQPGGYPQQQPGGYPQQQPGGYPQQPGGQGNPNQAAVAKAQQFTGSPSVANGQVVITQAQWKNGSNVTVTAAELECVQVSAQGQGLTKFQTVLNGPSQPGQVIAFPTFTIGAEAQGAAKVDCGIVAVQTAN